MKHFFFTFSLLLGGGGVALFSAVSPALAQDANDSELEEVIVVGSQIKGAKIGEALAVSVFDSDDIDLFGVDSGEDLFDLIPEQGQNFFSEAESISGGINSARGDIGAFNLRNVGTGNTLVLLNGRRLVNSATFQNELVGGNQVPVNTVNSNTIPVAGLQRVEVLRDGASAIYGADAVAGVVNNVLKKDLEGLDIDIKYTDFESIPRDDWRVKLGWGRAFNDGRTHFGTFIDYYTRDPVSAQDDPRWATEFHRGRFPPGSSGARNGSISSHFGRFDVLDSLPPPDQMTMMPGHSLIANNLVNNIGQFSVYPADDSRCSDANAFEINAEVCGRVGSPIRYNVNEQRDVASDLERYNFFLYLDHDFGNGLESFTEVLAYDFESRLSLHPSASFGSARLILGKDNYYNPFGSRNSPNRLPDSVIGADVPDEGLDLIVFNYRFAEIPRIVNITGDTYRILQGLRGQWRDWNWETAVSWSRSRRDDTTNNRISNTLITEALNDPTEAAYNPFSGGVLPTNIERALVSAYRRSEAELTTFDFKISNSGLFSLPAGPVGFLLGAEYREESFEDDRDPRLDGTIKFTSYQGTEFPLISDLVNSSPTPDSSGSREVTSLFSELQIPVLDNFDVQLALRYEDFSDVGGTTVGKFAFGWHPARFFTLRGSYSQTFRAPPLITIHQGTRSFRNTTDDAVCLAADPSENTLNCEYDQRVALGNKDLEPEESDNYSAGMVWRLGEEYNFVVTMDWWSIEKTDSIGLLGNDNHTALDFLIRRAYGPDNCDNVAFNPAVEREAPTTDPAEVALYQAAGLCPVGQALRVSDVYINLDDRVIKGFDVGVYYDLSTKWGDWKVKFNASMLNVFDQEAGEESARLLAAEADNTFPGNVSITGFGSIIRQNGNQEYKHNLSLSWRNQHGIGAAVSWHRLGDFFDTRVTVADGSNWLVDEFDRYDFSIYYKTKIQGNDTRLRFGIKNFTDERAPLAASGYYGFFADAHSDYGRYYYTDLKVKFR